MCGRSRRCKGECGVWRRGRVRSCVRPLCAVLMTAGPDVIRDPAPNQFPAFVDALVSRVCRASVSTVSPSIHVCPHAPTSRGNPGGEALAPLMRARRWGCRLPGTVNLATPEHRPDNPRGLVSERNGDHLRRPALEQPRQPASGLLRFSATDYRDRTDEQQAADIGVPRS